MKVLGISPLDKDASASLVEDGRILFASGEERYSRTKQHSGFPKLAIEAGLKATGWKPEDIDLVAYAFLPWEKEAAHIERAFAQEREAADRFDLPKVGDMLAAAAKKVPARTEPIHGLDSPNQRMKKGALKNLFYRLAGTSPFFARIANTRAGREWATTAAREHHEWHEELERELGKLGLLNKLKRYEHHLSHAANAYLASGYERALVVTLDGYGSGLAGSVSLGHDGKLQRLQNLAYPYSLGTLYECVTSSLGYHPDRHAGKIVGLAAYGDPEILTPALMSRIQQARGAFALHQNLNVYFSRHLASHFPMVDVAAAYQHVLELVAGELTRHWAAETGCENVVLSGGVSANVKMNQRIHEVDGVRGIFVYPNMGDGGCGSGIAMQQSWPGGTGPAFETAYLGPEFSKEEIQAALRAEGLSYEEPEDIASEVAGRIHSGEVVARFDGRMEYGPRALGNRSVLYHAREPEVNNWLNKRLGRTEFMPFAPVTLWEARERCYKNLEGAEHAAQFMTVTFDCTDWMIENCPAAVHVDGTARPQLVKREMNPGYYDILAAYEKLSGVPCLINTSFNMHEEPIVCTPQDAIRAFILGNLHGLAIGPFFVPHPTMQEKSASTSKSQLAKAAQLKACLYLQLTRESSPLSWLRLKLRGQRICRNAAASKCGAGICEKRRKLRSTAARLMRC